VKIHCFQHVPFEGLAHIETWGEIQKHSLTRTRFFLNDSLPALDSWDALIILGGDMSVNDAQAFPWLNREKIYIEKAIHAGKKILGICLGAQLIADVLGSKVTRNPYKEIGWFPVQKTENSEKSEIFKTLPPSFLPFHWHGETFALPRDALHTLKSEACIHQAFVYKTFIVGLQFHLEMTLQNAQTLITHCEKELINAPFIQKPSEMLSDPSRFQNMHVLLHSFLDAWINL
jgi:GMP synthase (glutamine-hydrolysing)